jgi:hypothetical protein
MYTAPKMNFKYSVGPTYGKLIYDIMMLDLHKDVLEIGCLYGYSTSSFIQSLNDGAEFNFTVCDINISSQVNSMIKSCRKGVSVAQRQSKSVINPSFDFIFIDGNHSLRVVGEELRLVLKSKTKTILAHDTYIKDFKGAVLLRKTLQSHDDYFYLDYHRKLPRNNTHYGISFATRDEDIYKKVKLLFYRLPFNRKLFL